MKNLGMVFIVLSTLILFGCEETPPLVVEPPPVELLEYSHPPLWLQKQWGNSSTNPEYIVRITSENIIIYHAGDALYDFAALDSTYQMTVTETDTLFEVTAKSSDESTLIFRFAKHSPQSVEIYIDRQGMLDDIGPLLLSPYEAPGALIIEITIDDTQPTTLTLSSEYSGPLLQGEPATIVADIQADMYVWYLDGVLMDDESASSLSVNTVENPLSLGKHTIICIVHVDKYIYFDKFTLAITE